MNVEILMNDFRAMAQSLKAVKASLEWVDPESGDAMYSFEKDVLLGVFRIKDERAHSEKDRWFPQLTNTEFWKMDLLVDWELCQYVGLSVHSGDFKSQLNTQITNAENDINTITKWVENHRDVRWAWKEKEEAEE